MRRFLKKLLLQASIVALLIAVYIIGRWIYAQYHCEVVPYNVSSIEYDSIHGLWGGMSVKVHKDGAVEGKSYPGLGREAHVFNGRVSKEDFARLVFLINENNLVCIGDTIPKEGLLPDTPIHEYSIDFLFGSKYQAKSVGRDGYSALGEEMKKIGKMFDAVKKP